MGWTWYARQSNPRGQPGRGGAAHAVGTAMQSSGISAHPREEHNLHVMDRICVPRLQGPLGAGLRANPVHAFLAKATWKAGTADPGGDAGEVGRKTPRGPLAPSHCL